MKLRKIAAFFIAFLLLFSVIPSSMVFADKASELKELEDDIKNNKNKAESQAKLAKILSDEIKTLDDEIAVYEQEIEDNTLLKDDAEKRLSVAEEELARAEAEKDHYKKLLEGRLVLMYMNGGNGYADILFSAESFTDLINKMSMINYVVEYDREIFNKLEEIENTIRIKKEQIEEEKKTIEETITKLERAQGTLDAKRSEKQAKLTEARNNKYRLEAMVAQDEKDAAELRRQMAAENNEGNFGNLYDSEYFKWPLPGRTRISSPFGYRYHPITGVWKLHKGTDIPAPGGTKIYSPANGKITAAQYSSSYGYYVILDLGKDSKGRSWKMLFAHCSKLDVKKGDIVTKGDVLARVGTTGSSTGNHLHFELTIANVYKNVLDYVTPK